MLKYSEGIRNYMMVTGSLRDALTGGELRLYSGPVPVSPNDALGSATLLLTYNNAGAGVNFEASANNGTLVKSLAETWTGSVVADGTPTFFRFVQPGDTGGVSTNNRRVQGTVGQAGADMNITNLTLVTGSLQALDYFYLTMPEA